MSLIKDPRVYTVRTGTYRDVEDWRNEQSEPQGPWAVRCLDHDQRGFFPSYKKAKASASSPSACPICDSFDRRCIHCPSSREQWSTNPATGFTASTGHLMGNPVCSHHRYGQIPPGVDYLENTNVDLGKPVVEISLGDSFIGPKMFGVEYHSGDQTFWLHSFVFQEYMTATSAEEYQQALGFALAVLWHLNETLEFQRDSNSSPRVFETWEELANRADGKKLSNERLHGPVSQGHENTP